MPTNFAWTLHGILRRKMKRGQMENHCRFPTYPFLSTSALRLLSYFSLCPPSDIRHLPSNSHGRAMMMVVALKYPTFHYKGPNVECTGILLTFFLDLHPTLDLHCPGSQGTPLVSICQRLGLLSLFAFAYLTSAEPTLCRSIVQEPRCPRPSPLVSRVPQVPADALSLPCVPKNV